MTKSIRFTKMHGAGNDYIYVNTMVYFDDIILYIISFCFIVMQIYNVLISI